MKQLLQRVPLSQSTQLRLAWTLLILLTLGYVLWMSSLAVLRYTTFTATAFDLGNMDQVIWNTLHGYLFQWTNQSDNYFGPPIRLAQHVEPILLPLSLLYLIYPDPRTLLIFQTLVLASGTLPIFLLTRRYIPAWPLLAPVMATAYLFSPALLGENLYDFHPVSLATPLILYAFLALAYRRYGWFLVACILAMSCKEDVPFTMALFGLLLIWKYKLPRLGSVLIVVGLIWFSLAFFVVMPHFLGAKNNNFWYRYADLGSTPLEAVKNIVLHPWILFTEFVTLNRIYYLFSLLRSTSFLALLAPEWLLPTILSLAINLMSTDAGLYSGIYQYNATIIPFVMLATIHGTRRLLICWQRWQGSEAGPATLASLASEQGMGATGWLLNTMPIKIRSTWNVLFARLQRVGAWPLKWSQKLLTITRSVATDHWQRFSERMSPLATRVLLRKLQWYACAWLILMIALNWIIMMPQLHYIWPTHAVTDRERHIDQLLQEIPPDASVSAGDTINPHLTERRYVTVFPSIEVTLMTPHTHLLVDYIIVDLQAVFPQNRNSTASMLTQLVQSGQFCNLKQAEGVILLKRCGP